MIKITTKRARLATATTVVVTILLAAAAKIGLGTICAFGVGLVSFTCPLGFLQVALASRNLLPQLWLSVALVLLSIVLLGRFFCAWVCPTALLRDAFSRPRTESAKAKQAGDNHGDVQAHTSSAARLVRFPQECAKGATWASRSRYAILGGTLLSSFVFGFPVFCAICPVGLFFGTLFAVSRLFSTMQPSWELLLFPAILGVELLVLKSWCRSICPLGALLGLIAGLNRFLRPAIEKDKCLVSRGISCRVCEKECPEGIILVQENAGVPLAQCTKCLECYEKCPTEAIKLASAK